MDVTARLRQGLDFFGDVVRHVPPSDWDNPTPCAGWSARDLVGHVVGVMQIGIRMAQGGELGGSLEPVTVGADPVGVWERIAGEVREAIDQVDLAAERGTVLGPRPLSFSLTFPALDLFLHAWDLGQSVGSDVRIPDGVAAWIDGFLRQLPADGLRSRATFGPEQPAPAGADATARLMAFTGRVVPAARETGNE